MDKNQLHKLDRASLSFETIENCPVCTSGQSVSSYTLNKFGCTFQWNQCCGCGVTYQNPRLTKESLNTLYNSANFWKGSEIANSSSRILGYDDYLADEEMRMRNERYKVNRICRKVVNSGKLMDIACGSGTFLRAASEKGFDVHGIEIGEKIAQYGREKHGLDIITGDFEEILLPDNTFDLVTMWNADNIFRLPRNAWGKIYQSLRPGGYFIFNFLDNRALNRLFFNIIQIWRDCHSLYVHSKASVNCLRESTGFESVRFYNQWGFSRVDRIWKVLSYINYHEHIRESGTANKQGNKWLAFLIGCKGPVVFLPMPGYYWAVIRK
jgi:ubiquinone/menaquinone biosynthesis C-methylase UbiE